MQAAGGGEEGMAQRGRKLVIEWAAEDDAAGLQARYRRERQADVRPRLHGLWLPRTGRSARETAGVLGVHERTVQRWIGWYRAGGVAAASGRHAGGQGAPARLSAEQRAELADEVASVLAITLLPFSVLGPFVGLVLDRWSRRQILVIVSVCRTALAVGLAALVATGL